MVFLKTLPQAWRLTIRRDRDVKNIEILPREREVCAPHQAPQPLGPAPERLVPQMSENLCGLHPGE